MRRSQTLLLAVCTIGFVFLPATPARAALILTLDDDNPTVAVPSSGSFQYAFTGTISTDVGFEVTGAQLIAPSMFGNPNFLAAKFVNFPYSASSNGGTFVGSLFELTIDATSAIGTYDFNTIFGGLPNLTIFESNAAREFETATVLYEITLVPAAVQVPEPSAFAFSIAGLFAVAWRARHRIACR